MMREYPVQFCERLRVKFPHSTRRNIFVKTEKAARRVKDSIKKFIEHKLKLKVNEEKSKIAKSDRVKFLGMTIANGLVMISKVAYNKAMEKVRELIPRSTHMSIEQSINQFNTWYRGWGTYFSMTQIPAQLAGIEAHARRRYRARIVKQQKRARHLYRKLVKRGIERKHAARTVYSNRGPWNLSHTRALEKAYPKRWFKEQLGMITLIDRKLDHWRSLKMWVKLT